MDTRWGCNCTSAGVGGNLTHGPGHYYPTSVAYPGNHTLTIDVQTVDPDCESYANFLILEEDGFSPATDAAIQAHAIWMGLLINTPGSYDSADNDGNCDGPRSECGTTDRGDVSSLDDEKGSYLAEMPASAMTGNSYNGAPWPGGDYCWVVGKYGDVYSAYKGNDGYWYHRSVNYEPTHQTVQKAVYDFHSDIHAGFTGGTDGDSDTAADNTWGCVCTETYAGQIDETQYTEDPGHYYPTSIGIPSNHILEIDTDQTDPDNSDYVSYMVIDNNGSSATNQDISDHAIWTGLLVRGANDTDCVHGDADSWYLVWGGWYCGDCEANTEPCGTTDRWDVAPLPFEDDMYIHAPEGFGSASNDRNGDSGAGHSSYYCWVVGANGVAYQSYKGTDGNWYHGLAPSTTVTEQNEEGNGTISVQTTIAYSGDSLVRRYHARATYDTSGIQMLFVSGGDAPFDNPVVDIDNGAGNTTFEQDLGAGNGNSTPLNVARLGLRLVGNANIPYDLVIDFDHVYDPANATLPAGNPYTLTYRRGDANGDEKVSIKDAMVAAQYIAGNRPLGEINAVNLASVNHNSGGDKVLGSDDMFIAQYIVGLRDAAFDWTG